MIEAHESFGGTVIGGDLYNGTRATGRIADAFVRRALVLDFYLGALAIETLVQTGFDSSALGTGVGVASSGGYAQLRLQLPHGMMAMTRYDGVSQSRADSRCSSRMSFERVGRPRTRSTRNSELASPIRASDPSRTSRSGART